MPWTKAERQSQDYPRQKGGDDDQGEIGWIDFHVGCLFRIQPGKDGAALCRRNP